MRPSVSRKTSVPYSCLAFLIAGLCSAGGNAFAQIPSAASLDDLSSASMQVWPRDLYLEVSVNGIDVGYLVPVQQQADGALRIAASLLAPLRLLPAPPSAVAEDGWVDLDRIPGVTYAYDEPRQSLRLTAAAYALAPWVVHASDLAQPIFEVQRDFAALLNYSLRTGVTRDDGDGLYNGLSASLEGRISTAYGTGSTTALAGLSPQGDWFFTRLDTVWAYSRVDRLVTYRAGDITAGSLPWTRAVRLGGVQGQRDFSLQPRLSTTPAPTLTGVALSPSTVEVYVNGLLRFSQRIPPGPYRIEHLPLHSGSGTIRVVVTDAQGHEVVSERPFYASGRMLVPGLLDYSVETGFARQHYGAPEDAYTGPLLFLGTFRYGVRDWVTLEGHAEYGADLLQAGLGAVFMLGPRGIGSLSVAGSHSAGVWGWQWAGGFEVALGRWYFSARTQRTVGTYLDLATVALGSAPPPKVQDHISLTVPLPFENSSFHLRYSHRLAADDTRAASIGLSYHQRISPNSDFSLLASHDLGSSGSYSVYAGISVSFGPRDSRLRSTAGVSFSGGTPIYTASLSRTAGLDSDPVSWRLHMSHGESTYLAGALGYQAPFAYLQGNVERGDNHWQAELQMEGAVVVADGDVFFTRRVGDAFALVDVGHAGVGVLHNGRQVGYTRADGRLVVPGLSSYQTNWLSIDPLNLPLDAVVSQGTSQAVVPADRGGVQVRFNVMGGGTALVALLDEGGDFVPVGSRGWLEGAEQPFVVGYDGLAYLTGLSGRHRVVVELPGGGRCSAEFDYQPQPGVPSFIADVVCRSL